MDMQQFEHWEPYDANAALRNQITRTRADLGETLSELVARADVKARARQAISQARERTRDALREGTRTAVAQTNRVARAGASSAQRLMDRMGRKRAAIVIGGAAGTLVAVGVYALLRRRLPFPAAWRMDMVRLRLARARRERARRERIHTEQAHRERVHREQARRARGRRR
jgi:hypothetical protein